MVRNFFVSRPCSECFPHIDILVPVIEGSEDHTPSTILDSLGHTPPPMKTPPNISFSNQLAYIDEKLWEYISSSPESEESDHSEYPFHSMFPILTAKSPSFPSRPYGSTHRLHQALIPNRQRRRRARAPVYHVPANPKHIWSSSHSQQNGPR
jgi:hypothetical protein